MISAAFEPLRLALADGRYRTFAASNLASFVGIWMQRLIFGWMVWDITHSGVWLGLLPFCDFVAALMLGPLGGVLGDRMDKARLIMWCQAVFVASAFAAAVSVMLFKPDAAWLILYALIAAAASTLSDAARLSIIARLAAPEALGASVAISSISVNLARFIGPALGGLTLTTLGPGAALAACALLNAPFLWTVARIRLPQETGGPHSWFKDLAEGVIYAGTHPLIGRALLLTAIACLLVRPAYELMPGLVDALFHGGVAHVSGMIATIAVGALAAGINMARTHDAPALRRAVLVGAVFSAFALMGIVLSPHLWPAYACALALGFFISTNVNGSLILSQTQATPAFQSRVASLWTIIVRAGPALGALAAGALADKAGFRWPMLGGAIACLLAAWLVTRRGRIKA